MPQAKLPGVEPEGSAVAEVEDFNAVTGPSTSVDPPACRPVPGDTQLGPEESEGEKAAKPPLGPGESLGKKARLG